MKKRASPAWYIVSEFAPVIMEQEWNGNGAKVGVIMEWCDVSSVLRLVRHWVSEEKIGCQLDLMYELFDEFLQKEKNADFSFDNALVCKWFGGLARISPRISGYYLNPEHRGELASGIGRRIVPMLIDEDMFRQELESLVMQDSSISNRKKGELCRGATAEFLASVLLFAMERPFQKRDVSVQKLLSAGSLSPVVGEYIIGNEIPKPCRWFSGRTGELEQLHSLLTEQGKVFLHGIPGIGKSELAKAYAKRYGKDYTNILWLSCTADLKQMVTELDFSDDLPGEPEKARFQRHNRFLRSLKEDSLLILDNLSPEGDAFLDVILKYRCSILCTTRGRYENRTTMELTELGEKELLAMMGALCPDGEELSRIGELLHRHTFACELAARLLNIGLLTPSELIARLEQEKAGFRPPDRFRTVKDGDTRKATYYDHLHSLFSLCSLEGEQQTILRHLSLIPEPIALRRFARWTNLSDSNGVNDLTELGLIQPMPGRQIVLHPMIREVAVEELGIWVSACESFLEGLQAESLCHGEEVTETPLIFRTTEEIIASIRVDHPDEYLLFLENMFQMMEKYRYEPGMKAIIRELTKILSDEKVGTSEDRAVLLDCRAAMEKKPEKAIELEQEAIRMLGEVNAGNALLAANLHNNLGGCYHTIGKRDLAKIHMEQGIQLMEDFGLTGYHDTIPQFCNYASFLTHQGESDLAYKAMERLSDLVREYNSDRCLDFAMVQQCMGAISIRRDNMPHAMMHYQRAKEIFEEVYADQPDLLAEKRRELALPSPK